MGLEPVFYNSKSFDLDNHIISWLQKYMEKFLSRLNHPDWFRTILEDLHGNFHVPHGKYFFDETIIGNDETKLDYCIQMLNATIAQMETITKRDFFSLIKEDIKDTWCDISNDFYNDEWFRNEENYKDKYIGSLVKLRELMLK